MKSASPVNIFNADVESNPYFLKCRTTMKPLVLNLLFLISALYASAQNNAAPVNFRGSIIDSVSGKALSYVTIVLQDAKTKASLKTVVSQEDGSFSITAKPETTYLLSFAFVGYGAKSIAVDAGTNPELGKIFLLPSEKNLMDVTVTAPRPITKREIDGLSYDVSADPESPVLSALDIMRKVPLLSVDANDNIKLKGSGNYKILVNGKESALVAKNPSDVLKSMPATNIEKIEVITTPPAKYDAEGLAGIINIITKRKIGEGYNIGVNGRYNSVWGPGINVNGTYKQGKFGLSGYMGHNAFTSFPVNNGNTQHFFTDNSTLSQTGTNKFGGHRDYAEIETSYEFDSLNLLTASIDFFKGRNEQDNPQSSQLTNAMDIVQQQYSVSSNSHNTWQGLDAGFNYQRGFKKDKNRLLTLSYKYNYSPGTQSTSNIFSDTINFQAPNYQQYNKSGNKEHTIQLDYVHPFKQLTLEAGGKAIIRNNFSDFETSNFVDSSDKYVINPNQSDNFNYKQDILSLYNSYQYKWGKWNAKAGLRLEHTTINADFVSTGSAVKQDYNNFIPSVSIQRNFEKSSLTVGYTDRISRPGIYQLNPFVDASNPKFINTGNPALKPELNHTFELNYSRFAKGSVNIGLSYAFSQNSIQTVTYLEAIDGPNHEQDTVTVTTFQNLGKNSSLGLNANVNLTIIKNLTVSLNGQISHIWLEGTYNGQLYHNDGYTGNVFMNAGYKFGSGFRFGIDAGFFSGDVNLQGMSNGFLYSSYVLSKTFLKNKKLTLSLVANNPYSKVYTRKSYTTTPNFHQYSYNEDPYRTFAIRFNFKFGKLSSDIKRNQRGINNDDTKGGKSSGTGQ